MAILISKNHDRMNNGTGIPPVCFQNAQSCQPETHRRGRLCHKTAALLLVLLFSVGSPGNARAQTISREYSLKAAFLLNFAQFTAWPLTAFAHTNSPFVIGILGDDPFGSALDETLRGESWNGHPFVVRRNINLESACDCQLVFISRSEIKKVPAISARLKGRGLAAHTVHVKVRYGDFITLTRQITVEEPLIEASDIYRLGCFLLGRDKLVSRPLRLLGLGVANLREPSGTQLLLL